MRFSFYVSDVDAAKMTGVKVYSLRTFLTRDAAGEAARAVSLAMGISVFVYQLGDEGHEHRHDRVYIR